MPPHRHAYRPVVMGTRGVVTSAHPLASMAGMRMPAGRRQRGRRGGRDRGRAERGRAVHVGRGRQRAGDLARPGASATCSTSSATRRPRPTRPRPPRPSWRRAEVVRDAGQPGRLADAARALRLDAARARARAGDRAGRARRAADGQGRRVLRGRAGGLAQSAEAQRLYLGQGTPRPGAIVALPGARRDAAAGRRGRRASRSTAARSRARSRGRAGGRRLADRGRPGRGRADLARADRRRLPRLPGRDRAAARLDRVPDARDARHPRGLRPGRLGAQLGRAPPPPDRGGQAGLGRPARLRLQRPIHRWPACSRRATRPRSGRASTPARAAGARASGTAPSGCPPDRRGLSRPRSSTSRRPTSPAPTPMARSSRSRRRSGPPSAPASRCRAPASC